VEEALETGLLPGIPGKRCAHCNTQTTPLWRNGPDGPKTLCNACGVRDNRRHAKVRKRRLVHPFLLNPPRANYDHRQTVLNQNAKCAGVANARS
jgi:Zn ribbon nucleic-acid-binding protein